MFVTSSLVFLQTIPSLYKMNHDVWKTNRNYFKQISTKENMYINIKLYYNMNNAIKRNVYILNKAQKQDI